MTPTPTVIRTVTFAGTEGRFLSRIGWHPAIMGEGGTGGKSLLSLLSEPISPSSLLFLANFSLLRKRLRFFFSLLPTFSPYFSLLPTLLGPFLPPPYSVPPPSKTRCHGTEKNVRYSEDPVITNYLVNNKNIRYSGVTKLNNGIYTRQNSLQTCA